MKLSKAKQIVDGREYRKIVGIMGKTMVNDIAKQFSKNWHIAAFSNPSNKGGLLVIKRVKPLKKAFETYYGWQTGKGK